MSFSIYFTFSVLDALHTCHKQWNKFFASCLHPNREIFTSPLPMMGCKFIHIINTIHILSDTDKGPVTVAPISTTVFNDLDLSRHRGSNPDRKHAGRTLDQIEPLRRWNSAVLICYNNVTVYYFHSSGDFGEGLLI